MRVAFDHQIFAGYRYGGVARYAYELARRVGQAPGISASIIAPVYSSRYLAQGGIRTLGLHVDSFPRPGRVFDALNRGVEAVLLAAIRPDIVHETYYQVDSRAPRSARTVVTVHDMTHEKLPGYFSADGVSARKRAAVRRADRIVCVSENTRRDLLEVFAPDPAKIQTIYLGSSLGALAQGRPHSAGGRPYFLHVGLRGGYKDFDRILEALGGNPALAAHYDLIAFGSHGFTAAEHQRIAHLGLHAGRVRHCDGDDIALADLYRGATALVYPSRYEGFGIPPLEAMSLGCPVLCSRTSSIPEVVGEAGLYFEPGDPSAISAAMERVANSADFRAELAAKGRQQAAAFSWDRCATETIGLYRSAVQD